MPGVHGFFMAAGKDRQALGTMIVRQTGPTVVKKGFGGLSALVKSAKVSVIEPVSLNWQVIRYPSIPLSTPGIVTGWPISMPGGGMSM
jgi:hypothetical protein